MLRLAALINLPFAVTIPMAAWDNTFGTTGMITTAIGTATDGGRGLALQPDGKIIQSGYSFGTNVDFAVIRYNADGSLDNTFSGDGMVTTAVGTGNDVGSCVVLQPDGKIVVGGKIVNGSHYDFGMVRYNSDGTLDAGFGTAGKVVTQFNINSSGPDAITLQSDGKILMAGLLDGTLADSFAVARYNADGSLDNTFNGNGLLTFVFPGTTTSNSRAHSILVQPDGKIVVAGDENSGPTRRNFAVARLNADGSMDATFGTGGLSTTDFGGDHDEIHTIMLQPDGKIVGAGYCYPGTTMLEFAIVRYNTNGTLDASFGTAGKIITEMGVGANQIDAIMLQTDGKMVAVGCVNAGATADFALARYMGAGTTGTVGAPVSAHGVSVYPNPCRKNITVDYTLQNAEEISVYVVDVQGRIIRSVVEKQNQAAGSHTQAIALPAGIPAGNYFAILASPSGQESYKIAVGSPE